MVGSKRFGMKRRRREGKLVCAAVATAATIKG
jgi:hypothetical protein